LPVAGVPARGYVELQNRHANGGTSMCNPERSGPTPFIQNLRMPMPISKKLRLIGRNNWIKVSRMQTCCGHPGEPGC